MHVCMHACISLSLHIYTWGRNPPADVFFFSAMRAVTSHPSSVPWQIRQSEASIMPKLIRR